MKNIGNKTPMVKQYLDIKNQHQDKVLLFRLGDFYEMFFDDAELVSRELELTLTGRGKDENRIPMCGIPYHALDNYLPRLINKGYKVAVCEQTEDPNLSKGLTKRDVVRIITPGTLLESNLLSEKDNNYLMAITYSPNEKYGLAIADSSTGIFKIAELSNKNQLLDEINRFNPAEILMPAGLKTALTSHITTYEPLNEHKANRILLEHFQVKSLESFGCDSLPLAKVAASSIIRYLKDTQKTALTQLKTLSTYNINNYMHLDNMTRRNLEMNKTIRDHTVKGSLLWVLDQTKTSMGARLLKEWLNQPLLQADKIIERQNAVRELTQDLLVREELIDFLKQVYDIERLTSRIASSTANAKDLIAVKDSLKVIPQINVILNNLQSKLLINITNIIEDNFNPQKEKSLLSLTKLIDKALVDDPPFQIKEGGLIKRGYNQALDEVWQVSHGGREWLTELEIKEKEQTGIKNLKVGFNKVFGYYIEVSKSNLHLVPEYYIRKQTLTNGERFITPELKEKETLILNASERIGNLEYEIFSDIRAQAASFTKKLQILAFNIAMLDVLVSLATVAIENNYCCPDIRSPEENILSIKDCRHPVIEKTLGARNFVPNDVDMNVENRFIVLSGPNMSGKSTYMRQIALILLMAQIGSFVPAQSAIISIVDRIFTRVGAMDNIFAGQSTFMVEMTEAANILHHATKDSFIILDELGRGTSTFDGMSLAWAIAEYIHLDIGAKTIFATHYHELTQLEKQYSGVKNCNVAISERGGKVTFLHRVISGGANKSYGVHVAKLAGLPEKVLFRAKEVLTGLELQKTTVMGDVQLKLF